MFKNPPSQSLGVSSVKHGRIFPPTWPLYTPTPFSSYNTSPHRKTINRWVGWEQFSARAARHLGKQASPLWFPGWREGGQASAWLSQSLRRTRKTWQKSLLPVTFIPQLTGCTRLLAQVWTHKLRVKQIFLHWNQQWGSAALACALCVVLSEENSPWLSAIAVCAALCPQLG